MSLCEGRYTTSCAASVADGWRLDRLTPASRLFGANGLRTGPDGRIYIAQVTGSQISALDLGTGQLETISAKGGEIIAPDDVAFDPSGDLYATEVMDGRVSVLDTGGRTRVLRDDVPAANGITVHRGRLFIGECRVGGRLVELDLNGGAPRVLLENIPMPNAMEVGPDGILYFLVIGANEIWRIDPEGGEPHRVALDLAVPSAVKFDSDGYIVSTQVHSGQVLRIDPRTGDRTVLAALNPGLDNLTFVGDRVFVSNGNGDPDRVGGRLDLAAGSGDGRRRQPLHRRWEFLLCTTSHRTLRTAGMLFTPGYPGLLRGLAAAGAGEFVVTTAGGQVSRYRPGSSESEVLADGFDQLYGVAVGPGGAVLVAVLGTGRVLAIHSTHVEVLASGLSDPVGVAIAPDGTLLVSESGAGRVVTVTASGVETLVDGLRRPQGIVIHDGQLYIVDAVAKTLIAFGLNSGMFRIIASGLPVGAAPGVVARPLRGMPPFSGPQGPFAGIAAGPDGALYLSADGDGNVIALRRDDELRQ
jgi:sugar lactone lactonase YvrE